MATAMRRLSTQLLVIGGGASGLGIAWDACLRGIKTVLVEKGDIGEGTSGRYHGLLHSGGRYALSDPQSASDCASENKILREVASAAIEESGGYFVSTPTDPLEHPDPWFKACLAVDVSCEEISSAQLLKQEPLLNPRISRAFQVQDASLDSFDLAHMLMEGIRQAGGKILLRHAVTGLSIIQDRVQAASVVNHLDNKNLIIEAEFVINAAGPWTGVISKLANIVIPLTLGKGTMLAMASRLTNAVVNRCRPPADGDIIVPVGTVCVLGTTDIRSESPEDLQINPWELDILLEEADVLIPGIIHHRPLRAWAGVRPLFSQDNGALTHDRTKSRSHMILDHRERDGIHNFLSVFGGKLTTFRLMAEEAVNHIAVRLGNDKPSTSMTTPLPAKDQKVSYFLSDRLTAISKKHALEKDMVICECELVSAMMLNASLHKGNRLDDIRRDYRLGMGPCQAAFCGFRAAGYAETRFKTDDGFLSAFTAERWKGIHSLAWGPALRQIEFMRRINIELLHLHETTQ
jgi:glycerol-3-phosphate dehydrogenase